MCGSMVNIHSATAENRRGKKKKEEEERKKKKKIKTTAAKYNDLPYWAVIKRCRYACLTSVGMRLHACLKLIFTKFECSMKKRCRIPSRRKHWIYM